MCFLKFEILFRNSPTDYLAIAKFASFPYQITMTLITFLLTCVLFLQPIVGFPFFQHFFSTGLTSNSEQLRLLELDPDTIILADEDEKLSLRRRGIKFMDITNIKNQHMGKLPFFSKDTKPIEVPQYTYPLNMTQVKTVEPIIDQIDQKLMYDNLAKFSSFYTRYYKSQAGLDAANWLSETIQKILDPLPNEMYKLEHVKHNGWDQYSIVVSIEGSETPENAIVLGSHLDSINLLMPSVLPAPGADDNGSGTITNLEALRLIVNQIFDHNSNKKSIFKNTIEFHFYSAEEGGLLGSLDVFTQYAAKNKTVMAMLQQDMTGYVMDPANEHIGVITDFVSPALTDFIKKIIDHYLDIPYVETECGYACSDHGSATKNGYPSAFVIESEFKKTNHFIHTVMDTLDRLSFKHMAEHVKLVVSFVNEIGNWQEF